LKPLEQNIFSQRLLCWFDQHGRHNLPWQKNPTAYRVWVSEIMLQQTQVSTVIPYYQRFMERFDSIQSLANSNLDEILQHWAGLGYYARGRNLHKSAGIILEQHDGIFPKDIESVNALPGIGRSTAGAILALSSNQHHAILDGNVKRILCRFHGISGYPDNKKIESTLWQAAEQHTPAKRVADYTQAIMDLGATLCTRSKPGCKICPQRSDCYAYEHDEVALLPLAKPRQKNPDRHRYMLALLDSDNNISLFKRPDKGIWGGLYSLPEFESRRACSEQLAAYELEATVGLQTGEDIQHAFSHFNLRITPLFLSLSPDKLDAILALSAKRTDSHTMGVMMNKNTRYNFLSDPEQLPIGVPTPIRKILLNLSVSLAEKTDGHK
jgi:A/G-specific adenine glycosylase